ncbi:phage replisome organizer N-terminal domain-containing protein [Paraclostridium sordellii]
MSNKKYYWLKLKENFFEEDAISWIEEQESGKDYCLFYLKLCLKSLKTNGLLIRNVGSMLVPYDVKTLARITNTDTDTVRVAMELFKRIGLVQILENGEIYISELQNMVGSETKWAEKKRLQRQKKDNVPQLSGQSPIEIEKEIDIEIRDKSLDKDKENINNSSCIKEGLEEVLNYYKREIVNRYVLTKIEEDFFLKIGDKIQYDLVIRAMEISIEANVKELRYIKGIIKKWLADDITTLEKLEGHKLKYDKTCPSKNSINKNNKNIHGLKTRYHNINQSFSKYDGDELEKMLLENQKGKFK